MNDINVWVGEYLRQHESFRENHLSKACHFFKDQRVPSKTLYDLEDNLREAAEHVLTRMIFQLSTFCIDPIVVKALNDAGLPHLAIFLSPR